MKQPSEATTIQFYDDNVIGYVEETINVDMDSLYAPFLKLLPAGGKVLDAGSGSGRDSKCFLEKGYDVDAIDASTKMVAATTELTGRTAKQIRFQELESENEFDGIWACASVLHVPLPDMKDVLGRFGNALKSGGVCYLSFKEGDSERNDSGRLFTDLSIESLRWILNNQPEFTILNIWITDDVRPGRVESRWVNALIRKS